MLDKLLISIVVSLAALVPYEVMQGLLIKAIDKDCHTFLKRRKSKTVTVNDMMLELKSNPKFVALYSQYGISESTIRAMASARMSVDRAR